MKNFNWVPSPKWFNLSLLILIVLLLLGSVIIFMIDQSLGYVSLMMSLTASIISLYLRVPKSQ